MRPLFYDIVPDFSAENCSQPLIWQNFPVQASVSTSSQYGTTTHADAPFDSFLSSWRAASSNTLETEFYQVDFHSLARVTKLQLRGGVSVCTGYVTEFQILYGTDPRFWKVYSKDGSTPTVNTSVKMIFF